MARPIGTTFGTHLGRISGGVMGSQIQKSEEAVKRLQRLAPNLVYVGGFVWQWT